jgi:hypothetical protein
MPDWQTVSEAFVVLVFLAGIVLIWERIFSKAGYSAWLGLTGFIPIVNIIMLVWLAFADWPVRSELMRLRENYIPKPPPRSIGGIVLEEEKE